MSVSLGILFTPFAYEARLTESTQTPPRSVHWGGHKQLGQGRQEEVRKAVCVTGNGSVSLALYMAI